MSEDKCHCPPFIDGGVLRRQSCTHHKRVEPKPEPVVVRDPELDEIACAWSDYRKDYGIGSDPLVTAHKAFKAGWIAARRGDQSGVLR
jgi:hypothetical protein